MKPQPSAHWDRIITHKSGLFDLRLKELVKYKDLLFLLVRRDFVAFYKQTALGPIWFFIQPMFTTFVYIFIFGTLAQISTDGIAQPVFYLSGIIAWSYFSDCVIKTSNVFRENAGIFGKVYFPRLVMPLSIVISNLVKFGIQLLLLIAVIIFYEIIGQSAFNPTIYLLALPFLVLFMALIGLGFGMIVSSITTKYRDIGFLVGFAMPLLMYATSVVYPLSSLGGKLKMLILINPMTSVIEGFRKGFFGEGEFGLYNLIYLIVFSIFTLIAGTLIFNKVQKDFVDTV
jgi:lipopolysaccharide transport system permease protein